MQQAADAGLAFGYACHDECRQEWARKRSNCGRNRKRDWPDKWQQTRATGEAHIGQHHEPGTSVGDHKVENQWMAREQSVARGARPFTRFSGHHIWLLVRSIN